MDWFNQYELSEQKGIIDELSMLIQQSHPTDDLINDTIYKAKDLSDSELRESFIKLLSIFKTTDSFKRVNKSKEIKKGCLQIVLIVASVILFLFLISRIPATRSDEKLERIAKAIYKYENHDFKETDKWDKFILLPYKENEGKNGLIFTWIYILDTGDTAKTYIELSREKRLLHDEEPLSISYNCKHSYIFKTDKNLINLLPKKYKLDSSYISKLNLSERQKDLDTINNLAFIVSSSKLYYYLNKGFYSVLVRYDNYTSIAFYEPIAYLSNEKKDSPTMTAKIIFNDSSEVLIYPYRATDKEWQNYNKE